MSEIIVKETENKFEYFSAEFDKLTQMDCSLQHKVYMLSLLYGNIEGFKNQFDKKIKKWILGSMRKQFIKFQKNYDFGYKIDCFNEFVDLFFNDHLPTKFHTKYEAYEKLMLEELEEMQMTHAYLLSQFTPLKKGANDPESYLLDDEYVTRHIITNKPVSL